MGESVRVAVIGAGIAGLAAALRLKERGFEVQVFEDRVAIGGKLGGHRRRIAIPETNKKTQSDDLSAALKSRAVPAWVQNAVAKHFSAQEQLLHQVAPKTKFKLGSLTPKRRRSVPHGGKEEWLITGPGGVNPFNITFHRREDAWPVLELSDDVHHEHCYHMFLNWYVNFWELMRDVGNERSKAFIPLNEITHIFPGDQSVQKRSHKLTAVSGMEFAVENMFSGAAPAPDMFLWFYSLIDIVSQPFNPGRYLDRTSVHAFMRSRWYETERSAEFHEYLLSKAFAVPTFLSSAHTYRKYVEYCMAQPEPMLWVLKNNAYDGLFKILERQLARQLQLGTLVTGLDRDNRNRKIVRLRYRPSDVRGWPRGQDDGERPSNQDVPELVSTFRPHYVIVAVPPKALAELVAPFRDSVPGLSTVRKLQSGVTAALDLYFNKKLDNIPNHHVVLRDSRLGLTFIDNSQCWQSDPNIPSAPRKEVCTCLNVAVTDFYMIDKMDKDQATRAIINDLKRFIAFEDTDIDFSRTYLQMNDHEPLFVNEVGSEPWRPGTRTEIENLFLAGDYSDNEIGIVCVEGAVVSGLLAARAVQAKAREDGCALSDRMMKPIPILKPDAYPVVNALALKLLLAPQAAAAKAWSRAEEIRRYPERAFVQSDVRAVLEDAFSAPGLLALDWLSLASEATQWLGERYYRDNS